MNTSKKIAAIAQTLGTGSDRIPLRRALRKHLSTLTELREQGLTWDQIAAKLTRAGARHKQGQAISGHQLRTEYARLINSLDTPAPIGKQPDLDADLISIPRRSARAEQTRSAQEATGSSRLSEILKTRPQRLEFDE